MSELLVPFFGGFVLYSSAFLASFLVGVIQGVINSKFGSVTSFVAGQLHSVEVAVESLFVLIVAILLVNTGFANSLVLLGLSFLVGQLISLGIDVLIFGERLKTYFSRCLVAVLICLLARGFSQ
jgi:hypothetical protein